MADDARLSLKPFKEQNGPKAVLHGSMADDARLSLKPLGATQPRWLVRRRLNG
jgi:hypothetical protein